MSFANVLPNGLSIQYLSRVDACFMHDTDGGFTSRVKGVGGAAGKCHVLSGESYRAGAGDRAPSSVI